MSKSIKIENKMLYKQDLVTNKTEEFIDITGYVSDCLNKSGIKKGLCVVYVPHTTAAVTINENADPDVITDIKLFLAETVKMRHSAYKHIEGNSAAHIKTSLFGTSQQILVQDYKLVLGTWQSVFFCEFDGPRSRKVFIKFIEG